MDFYGSNVKLFHDWGGGGLVDGMTNVSSGLLFLLFLFPSQGALSFFCTQFNFEPI